MSERCKIIAKSLECSDKDDFSFHLLIRRSRFWNTPGIQQSDFAHATDSPSRSFGIMAGLVYCGRSGAQFCFPVWQSKHRTGIRQSK